MSLFTSCDDYDDTELWNKVNGLEERIAALEEWQKTTDNNLNALQTLINTMDYITSVAPIMQANDTIGYTINFHQSNPISIYNGTTSQIGITQDEEGNWLWTLDGEILTTPDGTPIPANGQDAAAPQLSTGKALQDEGIKTDAAGDAIIADIAYLSVDEGETWYRVTGEKGEQGDKGNTGSTGATGPTGPAGANGDSFFENVDYTSSDDYVIFTLANNGGTFQVAKYKGTLAFSLNGTALTDLTQTIDLVNGNLTYTPADAEVSARIIDGEGWSASAENGTITVKGIAGSEALLEVMLTDNGRVIETYRLALKQSKLAGSGTEKDPYTISAPAELAFLAEQVNDGNNYSGETIQLTQDIDLNGTALSIGENDFSGYLFNGTFDGNNHSIKGLKISNASLDDVGLFPILMGGTVKNLILENPIVEGKDYVGALVGEALSYPDWGLETTIENCKVINPVVKGGVRVGGLIGYFGSGTIKDCQVTGAKVTGDDSVGGLAGTSGEDITNCSVTGEVTGIKTVSEGGIGGVVGKLMGTTGGPAASITACSFNGMVTAGADMTQLFLGGIVGFAQTANVTACYSSGTVQSLTPSATFKGSVGGIVGRVSAKPCAVEACYTTAQLSKQSGDSYTMLGAIAGRVGNLYTDEASIIETCYWKSDNGATNGIGWWITNSNTNQGEAKDLGTTKVDGTTTTWETAMSTMNTALSSTGWRYEGNTDEATKASLPLILVSSQAGQ